MLSFARTICLLEKPEKITAASLQIFFWNTFIPWFDVKSPPPEIFLEHLLQAFYGVDAPGCSLHTGSDSLHVYLLQLFKL